MKYKRLIILLIFLFIPFFTSCTNDTPNDQQVFGVWWWDSSLGDEYLTFAKNNGVNEIYYCENNLDEKSSRFIESANKLDIKVYWLIGDVDWLHNYNLLYDEIERYIEYNKNNSSNQYSGVHLDIEPHQDDNFDNDRYMLIYNLIEIANNLQIKYPNIKFDYDIPFWLEDEIDFNGVKKSAYKHLFDISNRIFLMSYRDSCEGMLDVSKEEISYATEINKTVVLGAETAKSSEGDNITYYEEGFSYLKSQINLLKSKLPKNSGVSIHHILSWYQLKP